MKTIPDWLAAFLCIFIFLAMGIVTDAEAQGKRAIAIKTDKRVQVYVTETKNPYSSARLFDYSTRPPKKVCSKYWCAK